MPVAHLFEAPERSEGSHMIEDPVAIVADDVALLRLGVTAVLEPMGITVAAETSAGREVPRLVQDTGAQLVILGTCADLPPPEVVRRLTELDVRPHVLVLLPRTYREELSALLSLDAHGLVVRSIAADELALSVDRVLKGDRAVLPALLSSLVGVVGPPEEDEGDDPTLTSREREVLALLAEGRSNREIAQTLYVTLATVKTHLAHIYAKLGARNRNEAIGRAVSVGLLG